VLPRFGLITAFFNVDKEKNLPTWFSSVVLATSAYVLAGIYLSVRDSGARYRWHWGALALVFAFLSMDEIGEVHEMASKSGLVDAGTASYLSWIVAVSPFVLVFAVSYFRFLLRLPADIRNLVACGGVLYVGGAVGMEIMGALLGRDLNTVLPSGRPYFNYLLFASAEEALEMLGAVVFLYAMARHLQTLKRADPGLHAAPAQDACPSCHPAGPSPHPHPRRRSEPDGILLS
jgi:hypothetical protein